MHTSDFLDLAARVFVAGVGLVMLAHFVAMAGYLQRAPRVVRLVLLPALAGLGMYLLGSGVNGSIYPALYVAGGCAAVVALYLIAWAEGAHVSETFEQRARERDMERMRYAWDSAVHGAHSLCDRDSEQQPERRKEAA